MKDYLERPDVMIQAKREHKGYSWFVELAIFLLVFIAGTFLQMLIMIPVYAILMFRDPQYLEASAGGNFAEMMEAAGRIMEENDAFTLTLLFTFFGITAASLLLGRWVDKRKVRTFGFVRKRFFGEYILGLVIGFIMFSAAVAICLLAGAIRLDVKPGSPVILILYFLAFMVQGMAEEVLCRGLLMVSLSRRYSIPVSMIINSIAFATLHLFNGGIAVLPLINLVLFGMVASVYFIKRGSIWGIAAVHGIWNFVQGNFYGIPVSGMKVGNSVFIAELLPDKVFINGGRFGLEGGIAVTAILTLSLVILWFLPGKNGTLLPDAIEVDTDFIEKKLSGPKIRVETSDQDEQNSAMG
ncbi:MAG: CPBP family intramembrane metalloprotease [Lachnospiraceae bacterium]|nr:CPBP family intramembrane metalloprotease [Lachnospiraceae bacterium]